MGEVELGAIVVDIDEFWWIWMNFWIRRRLESLFHVVVPESMGHENFCGLSACRTFNNYT